MSTTKSALELTDEEVRDRFMQQMFGISEPIAAPPVHTPDPLPVTAPTLAASVEQFATLASARVRTRRPARQHHQHSDRELSAGQLMLAAVALVLTTMITMMAMSTFMTVSQSASPAVQTATPAVGAVDGVVAPVSGAPAVPAAEVPQPGQLTVTAPASGTRAAGTQSASAGQDAANASAASAPNAGPAGSPAASPNPVVNPGPVDGVPTPPAPPAAVTPPPVAPPVAIQPPPQPAPAPIVTQPAPKPAPAPLPDQSSGGTMDPSQHTDAAHGDGQNDATPTGDGQTTDNNAPVVITD